MEGYKASYLGRKGDLGLTEQGVQFTPFNKGESVTIPYANLAKVNPPNPIAIFFKILCFPFVVLWFILCIFSRTSSYNNGTGRAPVKIYTKDRHCYVFYTRYKGRLVRQIRDHIQG